MDIIFQYLWKNKGVIPYAPGAFKGCISKSAYLISLFVIPLVSISLTESSTKVVTRLRTWSKSVGREVGNKFL